jgi:clan AA aspartic protease (TIGR02281 family)
VPRRAPGRSLRFTSFSSAKRKAGIALLAIVVVGCVVGIYLWPSSDSPSMPANLAAPVPAPVPASFRASDPLKADLETAVRESERAIRVIKEREAEQERVKKAQAEQARLAEEAKRQRATGEAEAERLAPQKEAAYEAWKARRKAGMRDTASNLRPDQVAVWNQSIAAWNRLSPSEREARFRQEYEQLASAGIEGADLSKSYISDADWGPAAVNPAQAQLARAEAAPRPQVEVVTEAPQGNAVAVELSRDNGIYRLPVLVNGTLVQDFVLDTGASEVQIPLTVFRRLVAAGSIDRRDRLDDDIITQADGIPQLSERVRLRSITVGGITCRNVEATIGTETAMSLLGQSFLARFRESKIDNARGRLILTP